MVKIIKEDNEEYINAPRWILYVVYGILTIMFAAMAFSFSSKTANDKVVASLDYQERGSVNYKVYYKENSFYTEPYIVADKTYIAQYINNIDVDFTYLVNYTDKLAGTYDYYVKARLVAYTPGDESNDLWTKDYKMSDVETIEFKDTNSYNITKNIKIDYQNFKEEYEKYRASSMVSSSAKLIVELVVNNHGKYKTLDEIDFQANSKIEIPLSDSTFQILKNSTAIGETKTIEKKEKNEKRTYILIVKIILWLMVVITAGSLVSLYRSDTKKLSLYEKTLKKILTTYDSIIVNVEKLPTLSNLSVVDVTSFEELVDAQNEVRLPINFKEDTKKKSAKFVLVRNNLAWVYTLKEGDLSEEE